MTRAEVARPSPRGSDAPPLPQPGWPARLARALGYNPGVRVRRHQVSLPGPAGVRPLRLAYASDFHAGPTTHPAVQAAACAALASARPDLLLLGGDFICHRPGEVDELAPMLGAVPAPLGRYAVLGNHDRAAAGHIVGRLERAGIEVLINRNVRLPPPFDHVWLCGLDDFWRGRPDAGAALGTADGTRIVLMHQPSGLLDLRGHRFELALCGHTHGGQIALPGGGPIIVPYGPLSRRYCRGHYRLEHGPELLVSVGIGCVILPFRTFADPEILVCEVHAGAGAGDQKTV